MGLEGHNPIWAFKPTDTIMIGGERLFLDDRFISAYDLVAKLISPMFEQLNLPRTPDNLLDKFFEERYLYEFRVPENIIHNDNLVDYHMCCTLPYLKIEHLVAVYRLECKKITIQEYLDGKDFVGIYPLGRFKSGGMLSQPIYFSTLQDRNLEGKYVDIKYIKQEYYRQLEVVNSFKNTY